MTVTLRQRMREYRHEGDIPSTPEDFECGRLRALTGTAIVILVGFALASPIGWLIQAAAGWLIPVQVAVVLGLVLAPIAFWFGQYVGGPVADHLLGIPREVEA